MINQIGRYALEDLTAAEEQELKRRMQARG